MFVNFLFHVGLEIAQLDVFHCLVDRLSHCLGVFAFHGEYAEAVFLQDGDFSVVQVDRVSHASHEGGGITG